MVVLIESGDPQSFQKGGTEANVNGVDLIFSTSCNGCVCCGIFRVLMVNGGAKLQVLEQALLE